MEPIKHMPKGLLESLQQKGYALSPKAVTMADMTNEGELRYLYLVLTDEQLVAAGIEPGMVRISVGLENVEDIIAR